jgi:protein arginine kinase activator
MLCEICKKNPATVHYTKIVNGKIEEMHLCEECAANNSELNFDSPFSFHKLWTGLIEDFPDNKYEKKVEKLTCPFCGLNYSQFRQIGKFGCAKCYEVFKDNLIPLFKGIHGHDKHVGKIPVRANRKAANERKIEKLKEKLNELIQKEAFEEAAKVRDQIKELEKSLKDSRE